MCDREPDEKLLLLQYWWRTHMKLHPEEQPFSSFLPLRTFLEISPWSAQNPGLAELGRHLWRLHELPPARSPDISRDGAATASRATRTHPPAPSCAEPRPRSEQVTQERRNTASASDGHFVQPRREVTRCKDTPELRLGTART